MAKKGGEYERFICKLLGRWWTGGQRDDVFWRTSQSGGRATTRQKRGVKTFGQSADICATDPLGLPLLKVFALELKRGYTKFTPFDVADKPTTAKSQVFEDWVAQAARSQSQSGSLYWAIIFKRDKRDSMIAMPTSAACHFGLQKAKGAVLRFKSEGKLRNVTVIRLSDFLTLVTPAMITE